MARISQTERVQAILDNVKRFGKDGEQIVETAERALQELAMKQHTAVVVELKKLKDNLESQVAKFCDEHLGGKRHLTLDSLAKMKVERIEVSVSKEGGASKQVRKRVSLNGSELAEENKGWYDKCVLGKRKTTKRERSANTLERKAERLEKEAKALRTKALEMRVKEDPAATLMANKSTKERATSANKYEAMQGKK